MAVGSIGTHAIGDVCGGNLGANHVVEENVSQGLLAFGGVKGGKVDAGVSKGLVGWGKDGEGSGALQGGEEIGLDDGSDQRAVDAG